VENGGIACNNAEDASSSNATIDCDQGPRQLFRRLPIFSISFASLDFAGAGADKLGCSIKSMAS
jgi:hypothetical protein